MLGNVNTETTPIIAKVINTSARVKARKRLIINLKGVSPPEIHHYCSNSASITPLPDYIKLQIQCQIKHKNTAGILAEYVTSQSAR